METISEEESIINEIKELRIKFDVLQKRIHNFEPFKKYNVENHPMFVQNIDNLGKSLGTTWVCLTAIYNNFTDNVYYMKHYGFRNLERNAADNKLRKTKKALQDIRDSLVEKDFKKTRDYFENTINSLDDLMTNLTKYEG